MKLARNVALMLAVAFAVGACDDDDPTDEGSDIVVADLAGSYNISSFTYITDDTEDEYNLTPLGMGVTEIAVATDGSFAGELVFPHPATGVPTAFDIGGDLVLSNTTATGGDLTINFDQQTQALGILDASESGSFQFNSGTGALTMRLTEVTVPNATGLPGGVDADLVMVATVN